MCWNRKFLFVLPGGIPPKRYQCHQETRGRAQGQAQGQVQKSEGRKNVSFKHFFASKIASSHIFIFA